MILFLFPKYEGAAFEDGKGPSIWDNFTHKFPEKILDGSNGDVADDFYHRYKKDVKLMKLVGLDAFRMSISWPRILPRGKLSGGVNKKGIAFYNNVFDELIANGITPYVTLFHWDVPQALEDEYTGFLSPLIIDDFRDFADLCFKEFGDRVKHWITLNEPFTFASGGYDIGIVGQLAPGRCSPWLNCTQGNSATEPYLAAHHLLLSHAAAVKLYKEKYQATQKGEIGITLVTHWMVPNSNSRQDVEAAQRALDFIYGWFADPVFTGDYPKSMRSLVKNRLPRFTDEQSAMLKGSLDFLGVNYYTGNYASHIASRNGRVVSSTDMMVQLSTQRKGRHIGALTGVSIFDVYPKGLHDLLVYTKAKYDNPKIYITETGLGDQDNGLKNGTNDPQRIDFYNGHLKAAGRAIKQGVNVKGLFAWTFMDTFEWGSGYTLRFGLYYVDYKNGLKRIPKRSALWLGKSIRKN
ncbi:hypothetical protein RD792_004418 [Penstemon davidsonii]|uniref:Beta-glucosidase n=1 Tax=Penstemon davidsonii TaxID=160366 RepID=A0ABR0DHE2_9LAMI|nr:hypothetical protein RD792_004418 [Penstemon davidsonii]